MRDTNRLQLPSVGKLLAPDDHGLSRALGIIHHLEWTKLVELGQHLLASYITAVPLGDDDIACKVSESMQTSGTK